MTQLVAGLWDTVVTCARQAVLMNTMATPLLLLHAGELEPVLLWTQEALRSKVGLHLY